MIIFTSEGSVYGLSFQTFKLSVNSIHLVIHLRPPIGLAASADAIDNPAAFQKSDAVGPDKEGKALRWSELRPFLAQPEESLLHCSYRLHDRHERPLIDKRSRIDEQALRKEAKADGEDITLLNSLFRLRQIDHKAVLSEHLSTKSQPQEKGD